MFTKVLIANRGAIATRIERTLSKMGIASVAVYSKADKDSLHVERADEAIYLGEGSAAETYLDIHKIIQAAKKTGAQAIHPGYGFLSENLDFAHACAHEGITFIGPTPEQIEQFGLKHVARRLAQKAQVPLLPGSDLIIDKTEALRVANEIGYPVMLKSTAGGGGIGMRICNNAEELSDMFDSVQHLAKVNFGDGGVFFEKYIAHARHVEVQIFGTKDDVVAITERDCSVQRRNQKVVEETPAPNLPSEVRTKLLAAAETLAKSVGYRNAGTVEFLYDESAKKFYFLEVNTRLQVEHGITEECTGIDLVEWMIKEAAGELNHIRELVPESFGCAIEVRVYAEDPYNGHLPSTGKIDEVCFSNQSRVETWIRKGVEVTTLYDPMLAKVIVHAENRQAAQAKMRHALNEMRVYGITTNLQFLESLFELPSYQTGHLYTHMLDDFTPDQAALEVLEGGIQTSVQDFPGFKGYWAVGVPPCGPMDSVSFRLANELLGNEANAPGLEMTMKGGTFRFRCDTDFALVGAPMAATLDGSEVPYNRVVHAKRGQILTIGISEKGMRTYLCVAGGFDMPLILGSASTFIDGKFGGHGGRVLRAGDVLRLHKECCTLTDKNTVDPHSQIPGLTVLSVHTTPALTSNWVIGVLAGPQPTEEFLSPDYLEELCSTQFTVGFDSARTGVRLNGPAPKWTRKDGGEAGLHPSNIHDNPYSLAALDLTGDQPILLGPDGPSLGGFVCPVVVAIAERWKLGQLRPGDTVRFQLLSPAQADTMHKKLLQSIASVRINKETANNDKDGHYNYAHKPLPKLPQDKVPFNPESAILYDNESSVTNESDRLVIRQSGEDAILVEFGPMALDIALRFRAHVLMQTLEDEHEPAFIDLTPGIRSLQVHFDPMLISTSKVCQIVISANDTMPDLESITVPSRIVHLPLSWDDPQTQLAALRYQETTRPDAPWCPSNPEFIRRINGLNSVDDVRSIVFDASYLVLGLGDVYLGAPVATPIDPRHRLVTTKYNPARPWTPENAVGIGGSYLCVYGMEGPGGYQFVGRTTQMWNLLQSTKTFEPGKPWLLNFFDQLKFYPVSAEEILQMREDCLRGRFNVVIEQNTFCLGDYLTFLENNKDSIAQFKEHQEASFEAEYQRWVEQGLDTFTSEEAQPTFTISEEVPEGCQGAKATIAGAVWKQKITEGQNVSKGDEIFVLESMKMEFPLEAPVSGTVEKIYVEAGDAVNFGQLVAAIRPEK